MKHKITVTLEFESDEYNGNTTNKWDLEQRLQSALLLWLMLDVSEPYVYRDNVESYVQEVYDGT